MPFSFPASPGPRGPCLCLLSTQASPSLDTRASARRAFRPPGKARPPRPRQERGGERPHPATRFLPGTPAGMGELQGRAAAVRVPRSCAAEGLRPYSGDRASERASGWFRSHAGHTGGSKALPSRRHLPAAGPGSIPGGNSVSPSPCRRGRGGVSTVEGTHIPAPAPQQGVQGPRLLASGDARPTSARQPAPGAQSGREDCRKRVWRESTCSGPKHSVAPAAGAGPAPPLDDKCVCCV